MKAFRAREVTPLLVRDKELMARWKRAAAEDRLIAKSAGGENWVLVLDQALVEELVRRGLVPREWEEA